MTKVDAPGVERRSAREWISLANGALALTWRAAPLALSSFVLAAVVGAVVPVVAAWLLRSTLDHLGAGGELGVLVALATGVAAAGVAQAALPQVEQYLGAQIDRAASTSGMEGLHVAVDRFIGLRRFEDPVFLDRLRMANMGTRSPGQAVGAGLSAARGALTLIGFVGSLMILSPVMTAVVLAAAVPTLLAGLAVSRRRATMMWNIGPAERREIFYSSLLTQVEAAKEIRLFGIGAMLRDRMLVERRSADSAKRGMDRRDLLTQGGLALLAAVVSGGGLIWTIRSAQSGAFSVGDVALFIAAVAGTQGALSGLVAQVVMAHEQLITFGYLREIVRSGPDLVLAANPRPTPPLRRGIEFDDVWFRYSEAHPWALRGVSLFLPSGQSVALVGRNGAGKSTIVKLLCRLYDPTRGTIRWDGVDIRELDPRELRTRVTAVFQDFVEYDLTAAENVGIGDVSAIDDRDRVIRAATQAGVHDLLSALPAGYETLLSRIFFSEADREDPTTGVTLSGGQWQRLALARALMRDEPDLMILDEPSAGLDAEAEAEIHSALTRLRAGRTSLLISHRLSTVRDAQRIIVLDEGVPVEQGTHEELLASAGTYAMLFRQQAAGYADVPVPTHPMPAFEGTPT